MIRVLLRLKRLDDLPKLLVVGLKVFERVLNFRNPAPKAELGASVSGLDGPFGRGHFVAQERLGHADRGAACLHAVQPHASDALLDRREPLFYLIERGRDQAP